ncbi:MAG: DMT family transporter [Eubacteriales bacterium]
MEIQKEKTPSYLKIFIVLILCGLSGMTCGPLMKIQMASGISPMWVAFLRQAAFVLLFCPIGFFKKQYRQEIKSLSKKSIILCGVSGLLLTAYFILWILALKYTSSFNTVTVICSQFIFIALLGFIFLKEKLGKIAIIGAVAAFIGIGLIGYSDWTAIGDWYGTAIAAGSAFMLASYWIVGRVVRREISVIPYMSIINIISGILLGILAVLIGGPLRPLSFYDVGIVLMVMLFGSVFGHLGPNWSVKYITSEVFGITQLFNPVYTFIDAALIAWIFNTPYESMQLIAVIGCVIIVLGIATYMYLKNKENLKKAKMNQNSVNISEEITG